MVDCVCSSCNSDINKDIVLCSYTYILKIKGEKINEFNNKTNGLI